MDFTIVNEKKSNSTLYHNAVIKLLNNSKHYNGEPLSSHNFHLEACRPHSIYSFFILEQLPIPSPRGKPVGPTRSVPS